MVAVSGKCGDVFFANNDNWEQHAPDIPSRQPSYLVDFSSATSNFGFKSTEPSYLTDAMEDMASWSSATTVPDPRNTCTHMESSAMHGNSWLDGRWDNSGGDTLCSTVGGTIWHASSQWLNAPNYSRDLLPCSQQFSLVNHAQASFFQPPSTKSRASVQVDDFNGQVTRAHFSKQQSVPATNRLQPPALSTSIIPSQPSAMRAQVIAAEVVSASNSGFMDAGNRFMDDKSLNLYAQPTKSHTRVGTKRVAEACDIAPLDKSQKSERNTTAPSARSGSSEGARLKTPMLPCCKFTSKQTQSACQGQLIIVPHKRGYTTAACPARHTWVWCSHCCKCSTPGKEKLGCSVPVHWYERDAFDTGARNHMNVHREKPKGPSRGKC